MAISYRTNGRHGYAAQFSPYFGQRIAVSACQQFGISGNATLYIVDITPEGLRPVRTFEWRDGLFDVAWSEATSDLILTASGDGSIQVWNLALPAQEPQSVWRGHSKETYCLQWSQRRGDQLVVSGSWDKTIRLWDPLQGNTVSVFTGHDHVVYSTVWSPHIPGCFASTSGDKTLRIWDLKRPHMANIIIPAHDAEVLSCDWCKYDENILATGAVDSLIRLWDLRNPRVPIRQLAGHQYAVRRVKFSPHLPSVLGSCSYDFSVRFWDFQIGGAPLATVVHHTEFVYGLDFNLHVHGQVVDCGWDEMVRVYSPQALREPSSVPLR